jgi:predicted transcriptional regulator
MTDRHLYRQVGDLTRSGPEKLFGELEGEIMAVIWRDGPLTVRQVLERLRAARVQPVAYTTVLTVMQRLAEKELLGRTLVGNTHRYAARQSRDEFMSESSGRIVRALVDDFGDVAIAQFLAALDGLDPERLERLRELGRRGEAGR